MRLSARARSRWSALGAAWRSERGQGLVEYALIIVVVSIGVIASLTFLRGEIRGIFSKAGSSLQLADGGGGSGGSSDNGGNGGGGNNNPAPPSSPGTLPGSTPGLGGGSGSGNNGYFVEGNDVTSPPGNNTGFTGLPGVYTNNPPNGTETGDACAVTTASGVFSGVWINHNSIPGNNADWDVTGGGQNLNWACVVPTNGSASVAITSGTAAGDDFVATTSNVSGSRSWEWRRTDQGVTTCAPPFGNFVDEDTNSSNTDHSGNTTDSFTGYCIRIVVVTSGGAIVSATQAATAQPPARPTPGSVSMDCPGNGTDCDSSELITATTGSWNSNGATITSYRFEWAYKDDSGSQSCTSGTWNALETDTGSATQQTYQLPSNLPGSGDANYRVQVWATNSAGESTVVADDCTIVRQQ